jgi:hypothetical protein
MNQNAQGYGHTRVARLIVLGICVLLSACGLFPQKDVRLESLKDGVTVVSYPAEMRGAYIIPGQGQDTVCSEPAPDVALKSVAELSSKLSANVQGETKLDAEAAAKVTTEAIQLAGRTQLVLVARDMLYSLCSVSRNNRFSPEQVKEIYSQIAQVLTVLATADETNANARYQEARNQAKAFVEDKTFKVNKIVAFLSDQSGNLIKGKLEELFTKIDQGVGTKPNDVIKNRLRRATNAADMKEVLLDITPNAINPLYDALPK